MATLTTTTVPAFAHCRDPRCPGTEQEPVDAIRHLTEWSFVDNGGNLPGVERSSTIFAFADETQMPCPHCSVDREVSIQKRPNLPPLSGHRQDGLLYVKQYDSGKQPTGNDAIVAQLMAQVAELSAKIASGNPGAQLTGGATPDGVTTVVDDTASSADEAADDAAEQRRQADIRARRMAALAKAREAKAAKAKE